MCFSDYSTWNRALLNHFFPTRNENPILYLDETLLDNVAKENHIDRNGDSFSEDLLSCTLISQNNIGTFFNALVMATGNRNVNGCRTWTNLVGELMESTLPYTDHQNLRTIQVPAYFAMLCSIMLLASRNGANHNAMSEEAQRYLENDGIGRPGALVNGLMQQLHKNFQSFDPDRMVGDQTHMGRIKYHLVLTKSQRDDFIDFIEVNNLRWECGSFESFVNDIIVPALDNAGKNNLSIKVTQDENISYFKNILCDNSLRWGKENSELNNRIQEKVFKWKYECRFDYDGKLWFNIYFDYHLPFGLCLREGEIARCDTSNDSEYIARNLDTFPIINPSAIEDYGISYRLCNVNDGLQDNVFYFEAIGDDFYRQVDFPEEGKSYYVFLSDNDNPRQEWEKDASFILSGYSAYKIGNYKRPRNRRADNNNKRLKDKFDLTQCGSYFTINIEEGQELWWKPNVAGANDARQVALSDGEDGKKYFRIDPDNQQGQRLSGSLFVKSRRDTILSEQISTEFKWAGSKHNYHLDSWGRVVTVNDSAPYRRNTIESHTNVRKHLQNREGCATEPTPGTEMLLQILHDIADENGCIYGRKISDALDFVLSNFGISPTIERRKSILYALRWLGYIIADYDINKRDYVNQLIPKYIEKSGYSVSNNANAYILKGTYCINERDELIRMAAYKLYLRPYDEETLKKYPEYRCLPDTIILEGGNLKNTGWAQMDHPVAYEEIYDMANMNGFIKTFGIDNNGDRYNMVPPDIPSMVESDGNIVLCTKRDNVYYTHKYYNDNSLSKFIPKPLAKVFVQNSHSSPVCAMSYGKQAKNLIYSGISFFEGMGVPDLLHIALSDLNLGMPSADYVFIVEKDSISWYSSLRTDYSPITKMFTYKTTAKTDDHKILVDAVRKLSGGRLENDNLTNCPEIVLAIKEDSRHEMIMSKDSHCTTLFLYENEQFRDKTPVAFSVGSRVYYRRPNSEDYRRVTNEETVNFILSQIINGNGKNLNISDETKNPPEHTDSPTIKIIKKHSIKQS